MEGVRLPRGAPALAVLGVVLAVLTTFAGRQLGELPADRTEAAAGGPVPGDRPPEKPAGPQRPEGDRDVAPEDETTTSTSGAAMTAPPVRKAEAFRDHLLDIAAGSLTAEPGPAGDFGVRKSWGAAFPEMDFTWHALKANRESVSLHEGLLVPWKPRSDDNPFLVSFAVADAKGRCAGGVLVGHPAPAAARRVDMRGAEGCTALEAAALAGYPVD